MSHGTSRAPPMVALLQAVLPGKYATAEGTETLTQLKETHEKVFGQDKKKKKFKPKLGAGPSFGGGEPGGAKGKNGGKSARRRSLGLWHPDDGGDQYSEYTAFDAYDGSKVAGWPWPQDDVEVCVNPYLTVPEIKRRYGTRTVPFQPNHDCGGSEAGDAAPATVNTPKEGERKQATPGHNSKRPVVSFSPNATSGQSRSNNGTLTAKPPVDGVASPIQRARAMSIGHLPELSSRGAAIASKDPAAREAARQQHQQRRTFAGIMEWRTDVHRAHEELHNQLQLQRLNSGNAGHPLGGSESVASLHPMLSQVSMRTNNSGHATPHDNPLLSGAFEDEDLGLEEDEEDTADLVMKNTGYFEAVVQAGVQELEDHTALTVTVDEFEYDPVALHQRAMMNVLAEERQVQDSVIVSIKTFLTAASDQANAIATGEAPDAEGAPFDDLDEPDFKPVLTRRKRVEGKVKTGGKRNKQKVKKLYVGNRMLMSALPLTEASNLRAERDENHSVDAFNDRQTAEDLLLVDVGDDEAPDAAAVPPSLAKWFTLQGKGTKRATNRKVEHFYQQPSPKREKNPEQPEQEPEKHVPAWARQMPQLKQTKGLADVAFTAQRTQPHAQSPTRTPEAPSTSMAGKIATVASNEADGNRRSVAFALPDANAARNSGPAAPPQQLVAGEGSSVPSLPEINRQPWHHQQLVPRPPPKDEADPEHMQQDRRRPTLVMGARANRLSSFVSDRIEYVQANANQSANPKAVHEQLQHELMVVTGRRDSVIDSSVASDKASAVRRRSSGMKGSGSSSVRFASLALSGSIEAAGSVSVDQQSASHAGDDVTEQISVDGGSIDWSVAVFPATNPGAATAFNSHLVHDARERGLAVPLDLICPITGHLFVDPVALYGPPRAAFGLNSIPTVTSSASKARMIVEKAATEACRHGAKETVAPHLTWTLWEFINAATVVVPSAETKRQVQVWRSNTTHMLAAAQRRHAEAKLVATAVVEDLVSAALTEGYAENDSSPEAQEARARLAFGSAPAPVAASNTAKLPKWPEFKVDVPAQRAELERSVDEHQTICERLQALRELFAKALANSQRVDVEFNMMMHDMIRNSRKTGKEGTMVDEEATEAETDAKLSALAVQRAECAELLEKLEGEYSTQQLRARAITRELGEHNKLVAEYMIFLRDRNSEWGPVYMDSLTSAYSVCQLLADREFVARGAIRLLERAANFLGTDVDTLVDTASMLAPQLEEQLQELIPPGSAVRVFPQNDPIHARINSNAKRDAVTAVEDIPPLTVQEEVTHLPIHPYTGSLAAADVSEYLIGGSPRQKAGHDETALQKQGSPGNGKLRSRKSIYNIAHAYADSLQVTKTQRRRPPEADLREPWWHFPPTDWHQQENQRHERDRVRQWYLNELGSEQRHLDDELKKRMTKAAQRPPPLPSIHAHQPLDSKKSASSGSQQILEGTSLQPHAGHDTTLPRAPVVSKPEVAPTVMLQVVSSKNARKSQRMHSRSVHLGPYDVSIAASSIGSWSPGNVKAERERRKVLKERIRTQQEHQQSKAEGDEAGHVKIQNVESAVDGSPVAGWERE